MTANAATIDGRTVAFDAGETILDAATRLGVEIPTLCHVPGLPPEGGCRLCLVQADPGGRVVAACHTALADGMTVTTTAPAVVALQRDVLALTLSEHAPRTFRASATGSELERLMDRFGLEQSPFGHRGRHTAIDDSHPYLCFDRDECITCRRCMAACAQVQGQFVYNVAERGPDTRLIFGPSERFADSDCTACGACVDVCPTGAITDRDRIDGREPDRTADSVCGYCGVGCRVTVHARNDRVIRIDPVPDAAVNRGHLCAKGRYAHAYHHSADRLAQPMRREGDGFTPIGWDEANRWLADRLDDVHRRHGGRAMAALSSSRSTNEAAYLLQKLFRTRFASNNVDCCARVCHSSTALALQLVTGTGAASASYTDIERAGCIVVAGANPTEAHPVVGARIKQAALRGTPLIVIDPRRIELAEYARVHLALRPGTNVALFNALARELIVSGRIDRAFIDQHTEGFEALAQTVSAVTPEDSARITGVAPDLVREAAALLADHAPGLYVSGLGLSETVQGTAAVMLYAGLAMLRGDFGRPGCGVLPLRGQNNVQGNADMGGMPNQVTGYQPLDDDDVRARCEAHWGVAPPSEPGLTIPEMFDAAVAGDLRAMWIQGEDVVQSDPHQAHTIEALEALDLLVVQELFMTETTRYAHLVLPAAAVLEQEGTFTNGERRIQHVRPAVAPPGEARPDWIAIRDIAAALGETWDHPTPASVMDEIAAVAPRLFGGVSYDRLDGDGLQWPCPDRDHPGTATVHAGGFIRGRGQLVSVDHAPDPECAVDAFPYVLVTGRVLQHYNVGTMTRRTPHRQLVPDDRLEIHPADADREGIGDGATVEIESRWGRTRARAHRADRVAPGTLFLSFHYPETGTNRLIGPHVDPQSKCPGYKVTAVRIGGGEGTEGLRD